jgi:hypothetical protein
MTNWLEITKVKQHQKGPIWDQGCLEKRALSVLLKKSMPSKQFIPANAENPK